MIAEDNRNRTRRWLPWAVLLAIVVLGAWMRWDGVSMQPVNKDEVFTYLTAQGFASRGQPVFEPTGYPYPRAFPHTALVGAALVVFGDDLQVGRVLSVVASLLVLPVYVLLARRWSGWPAALIGAAILATSRWEIFHSVNVRMYPFFQLTFLATLLAGVRLIERPERAVRWLPVVALLLLSGTLHALTIPVAPFVIGGLIWYLRDRSSSRALMLGTIGMLAALVIAALPMLGVEIGPAADVPREPYGNWAVTVGNPFLNVGLSGLRMLHERIPLIPWLAILAAVAAWSRRERPAGFVAAVALGGVIATSAGTELQIARYYFHLAPLFVALGVLALEREIPAMVRGVDVVGELTRQGRLALARLPGSPSPVPLALAGGVLLVLAAVLIDPLLGRPFSPGGEQAALAGGGLILLLGAVLAKRWPDWSLTMNRAFGIGAVLLLLAHLPAWTHHVGPTRFPGYQDDLVEYLRAELRPGDRLLTTEHLALYVRLGWEPTGFLSQKIRDGAHGVYLSETDLATGVPFVDSKEKLDDWLSGPQRTFVVTDQHFRLHLSPEFQQRVLELPTVFETDPAKLLRSDPHPEWTAQTFECAVRLYTGDGGA